MSLRSSPYIRAVVYLLWVLFAVMLWNPRPAVAESSGRVVLILIDRVTWPELAQLKPARLQSIFARGAVGLLANRTAKRQITSARSYLTIGAGARADADTQGGKPLTQRRFNKLKEINKTTGYNAQVGALAEALRSKGKRLAVLGNADSTDEDGKRVFGREAGLIGVGPEGDLAGNLSRDLLKAGAPGDEGTGLPSTDYDRLMEAADRLGYWRAIDLLIIETGDTRRADVLSAEVNPGDRRRTKKKSIRAAEKFVDRVAAKMDFEKDLLVVASPSPPIRDKGKQGQELTPVLMVGRGIKPGLLTSGSTRRLALITSSDIAPTIAAHFDTSIKSSVGRPVSSTRGEASFRQMAELSDEYLLSEDISVPVILGYGLAHALVIIFAAVILLTRREMGALLSTALSFCLLFALSSPLAIFLTPFIGLSLVSAAANITTIVFLISVLGLLASRLRQESIMPLYFITGSTTVFLLVNVWMGSPADAKSAFGYTAINGGRYYGIGNHYVSILAATALVASVLWSHRVDLRKTAPRRLLGAFYLLTVVTVGFGGLGANTGGFIMLVPAFTLAFFWLSRGALRWRHGITAAIATIFALSALIVSDAILFRSPAHLGIVARQVYGGSVSAFLTIIKRKLMINAAVFNATYLSYIFALMVVAIVVWRLFFHRPNPSIFFPKAPDGIKVAIYIGFISGLIGAFVNDSGIAIMAMTLGYLALAALYYELFCRDSI